MANYNLNEVISTVEDLINRINTTIPVGTRQEQYNQFTMLRQEIDQWENTIDYLEDQVKADYRAGIITREEYRNIDRILDALDDRLDRAEDRLEVVFMMG